MAPLLHGKLASASALIAKLKRDHAQLVEEVNSDRLFNFVVTGYSLIDWVKHDPTVPEKARKFASSGALHSNEWLKVCGDIATAAKHFTLTTRTPITGEVSSAQGYNVARYGKGPYGVGEENIVIRMLDGREISLWEFVPAVVAVWDAFFAEHGIPS
jgi:hypothetical protein